MCRLYPASALDTSAMASALEGQWTGTVIAEVPPDDGALFSLFLVAGTCTHSYAIAPTIILASENACATHCLANSACQFYSVGPAFTAGDLAPRWYCTIFPFCIGEFAANYSTFRIFPASKMVGAQCTADLTIRGIVVDLSVHSCGGGGSESPAGVRRSPQTGALRGIILPAGPNTGSCDALAERAAPCQGMLYPLGMAAQAFPYWRLRVRWTGSSRDRNSGDVDNVLMVMNLTDGENIWPLQLAMYPDTDGEPNPESSFDFDYGGGGSGSFPVQSASRLRLRRAAAQQLPLETDTNAIDLLSKAYSCSTALDGALELARNSADCASVVNALFPSAAVVAVAKASVGNSSSAARILLAKSSCGNPCLPLLSEAIRSASSVCTNAWHSAPLADAAVSGLAEDGTPVLAGYTPGVQVLLMGLIRAADAVYLLDVACATNWLGASCTGGPQDLPASCPTLTPKGSLPDSAADQTLMIPVGADGCGDNCSAELSDYIYIEGCCSATIANAQASWMDSVSRLPALGSWFWVDWGGNRQLELFRPSDACPSPPRAGEGTAAMEAAIAALEEAVVGIECRAELCGLAAAWPSACCNSATCLNGGAKVRVLRFRNAPSFNQFNHTFSVISLVNNACLFLSDVDLFGKKPSSSR